MWPETWARWSLRKRLHGNNTKCYSCCFLLTVTVSSPQANTLIRLHHFSTTFLVLINIQQFIFFLGKHLTVFVLGTKIPQKLCPIVQDWGRRAFLYTAYIAQPRILLMVLLPRPWKYWFESTQSEPAEEILGSNLELSSIPVGVALIGALLALLSASLQMYYCVALARGANVVPFSL